MRQLCTFIFIALFHAGLHAQNWVVGQPVDATLSSLAVNGGGCYPNAQALLNFNSPTVSGVTRYYRVVSITTDGEYTMMPGTGAALVIGDMVPLTPVGHQVFNSGSFGSLGLEVHAVGTPTTAGQAHPCIPNDLWMSNLLLCNEGLTCNTSSGCVTELGNGISDARGGLQPVVMPSAANGFQLQLIDPAYVRATVIDMHGRTMAMINPGQRSADLGHIAPGTYVVDAERINGAHERRSFVIAGL